MVFSSPPLFLDPPNNWHLQHTNQQHGAATGDILDQQNPNQYPHHPQFLQQAQQMAAVAGTGAGASGGVRPGSMAERARLAKLPMPETALKCPRCDSTNTKFCYFNNYSLTQPRHFCKTCRRYWTRGGALRNVPVGGGCRRNRRSKSSSSSSTGGRSKSPMASAGEGVAAAGTASSGPASSADILTHLPPQMQFHLPPLQHLSDLSAVAGVGLSFGGLQQQPLAASACGPTTMLSEGLLAEQWRFQQQFPFLAGLEPPAAAAPDSSSGLYSTTDGCGPSRGGGGGGGAKQMEDAGVTQRMASVKLEESGSSGEGLGLMRSFSASRNFFGNGEQYSWVGSNSNGWCGGNGTGNDLSGHGFAASSSTSGHLFG